MPIFEYSCTACGNRFEKLLRAADDKSTICPACGSAEVSREISAFSGAGIKSAECYSGG